MRENDLSMTHKSKKIALFGAIHLPNSAKRLIALASSLSEKGFSLLYEESLFLALQEKGYPLQQDCSFSDLAPKDVVFAISFGGDGTFLSSLHRLSNPTTPLLPINSGHLGFLTEVTPQEAIEKADDLAQGKYTLQKRILLSLYDEKDYLLGNAFNEIAIERGEPGALINVEAWINGDFLASYRGNGLLIATPSGSTAYSLSLNGPIIDPRSRILVLTPIAPHTLTLRPMVVPDNVVITLKVGSRAPHFSVAIDGKLRTLSIDKKLTIRLAQSTVNILKLKNRSFADIVRSKLLWGESVCPN